MAAKIVGASALLAWLMSTCVKADTARRLLGGHRGWAQLATTLLLAVLVAAA